MSLEFSKMHGAGNDFIVADNRSGEWPETPEFIRKVCHRQRGVGADGFFLLSQGPASEFDLTMTFYNCDGSRAEMCGNGLRCAARFAHERMGLSTKITFSTDAGMMKTEVISAGAVKIEIPVISQFKEVILENREKVYFGNTGVPHVVKILTGTEAANLRINEEGSRIRNHSKFAPSGTNVNFICLPENTTKPVQIRTFERGVEAETAACGTGISAAGIAVHQFKNYPAAVSFITPDNDLLAVDLRIIDNIVQSVQLTGPAVEVFRGTIARGRS